VVDEGPCESNRWRWPPESWIGFRSPSPGSWTTSGSRRPAASVAASDSTHAEAVADVLGHGHVRKERVILEQPC